MHQKTLVLPLMLILFLGGCNLEQEQDYSLNDRRSGGRDVHGTDYDIEMPAAEEVPDEATEMPAAERIYDETTDTPEAGAVPGEVRPGDALEQQGDTP